jgi:hypothetical protein
LWKKHRHQQNPWPIWLHPMILHPITAAGAMLLACIPAIPALHAGVPGAHVQATRIEANDVLVAKFAFETPWTFRTRLEKAPANPPRWKQLILAGQTDYIRFLSNDECAGFYHTPDLQPALIDAQRRYVISRFESLSHDLRIDNLYLVADLNAARCHLIVPLNGPSGTFFSSLNWIRGAWHIVPGGDSPPWVVRKSPEIVKHIDTLQAPAAKPADLDPVTAHVAAMLAEKRDPPAPGH